MNHPYIEGQTMNKRKYAIKLIPVENYKKATAFASYGKVTGRYHKSFTKPCKGVFTIDAPFKANDSLFSNTCQYSGVIKACNKLASP